MDDTGTLRLPTESDWSDERQREIFAALKLKAKWDGELNATTHAGKEPVLSSFLQQEIAALQEVGPEPFVTPSGKGEHHVPDGSTRSRIEAFTRSCRHEPPTTNLADEDNWGPLPNIPHTQLEEDAFTTLWSSEQPFGMQTLLDESSDMSVFALCPPEVGPAIGVEVSELEAHCQDLVQEQDALDLPSSMDDSPFPPNNSLHLSSVPSSNSMTLPVAETPDARPHYSSGSGLSSSSSTRWAGPYYAYDPPPTTAPRRQDVFRQRVPSTAQFTDIPRLPRGYVNGVVAGYARALGKGSRRVEQGEQYGAAQAHGQYHAQNGIIPFTYAQSPSPQYSANGLQSNTAYPSRVYAGMPQAQPIPHNNFAGWSASGHPVQATSNVANQVPLRSRPMRELPKRGSTRRGKGKAPAEMPARLLALKNATAIGVRNQLNTPPGSQPSSGSSTPIMPFLSTEGLMLQESMNIVTAVNGFASPTQSMLQSPAFGSEGLLSRTGLPTPPNT